MELHGSFGITRPRGLSCFDASEAYISSADDVHIPYSAFVEPGASSYPFLRQQPGPSYDVSFGISADSQFPIDAWNSQARKRRKLSSNQSPRRSSDITTSSPVGLQIMRAPGADTRHGPKSMGVYRPIISFVEQPRGQEGMWSLSGLSSFLCPCCNIGYDQEAGYHALPDAPALPDAIEAPYVVEKAPSVYPGFQPTRNSNASNVHTHFHARATSSSDGSQDFASHGNFGTAYETTGPSVAPASRSQPRVEYSAGENSDLRPVDRETTSPEQQFNGPVHHYHQPSSSLDASGMSSFHIDPERPLAEPETVPYPNFVFKGSPSQENQNHAVQYALQPNFDIMQPNQRGGKRGPFKDPVLREKTAKTRKMGSCVRCRMQRIRCEHNEQDPLGPCLTCKKVANTRADRLPCLRYKISDVRLYKPGQVPGYEWTKRWNNSDPDPVQKWMSSDIRIVQVSDGCSDRTLRVRVRKFVPEDGDKLTRTWYYNGEVKSVSIPPYALIDFEDTKRAYTAHIHDSMNQAFPKILGHPSNLLYRTYQQMLHCCKDKSTPPESLGLLRDTFRLWMSIRLSTRSCFIVGDETLDMPSDILDETSPTPGKIPLPPVLGAQLDLILIHEIQTKLRRRVLERLERLVSKRKLNTWMMSYLVNFVLLHNTAMITAHDAGYAKKHGMNRRFAREDKVTEYHLGANILLAHFHYCNKGVHPFSDECKDQELRSLAGLDDEQIRFIHETRRLVRQQRHQWTLARDRGEYENDYYFVSQLFDEQWQPRSIVI